jgi:hypothetical protein
MWHVIVSLEGSETGVNQISAIGLTTFADQPQARQTSAYIECLAMLCIQFLAKFKIIQPTIAPTLDHCPYPLESLPISTLSQILIVDTREGYVRSFRFSYRPRILLRAQSPCFLTPSLSHRR